jgi:hypothetical protein
VLAADARRVLKEDGLIAVVAVKHFHRAALIATCEPTPEGQLVP